MKVNISENDFPTANNFVYLNTANVSLMYSKAAELINVWQQDLAENGSNNFDEKSEETVFHTLHEAAGVLINTFPENIAVGSSATELLCSIAWAVSPKKHQNVISTQIVFPSTIYPWKSISNSTGCEIRLVKERENFIDINDLIQLIDPNTAVVSISHVEYSNGQIFDLELLAEVAHQNGALLIVDATQSAGAIPIDVQKSSVDILVSGAYKWLCGPFGSAFMYIAPHLVDQLDPGMVGFRSHHDMWNLEAGRLEYPEKASKFEFSTMAFGCALGLAESINYINGIGIENIFKHNLDLANYLISGLKKLGAKITSPYKTENQSSIVRAVFENIDYDLLIKNLKQSQVFVSRRGDSIRLSPHLYNTKSQIDKALFEFKNILKSLK